MGTIATIAEIVRVHAAERPDGIALVEGDREVRWAELYARSSQVADLLAEHGVGSQDRVALLEKNGVAHVEVFFGAALLNAVCVSVNWRLAPPEVAFIVEDSGAKVLVVGSEFVPVLDAIADSLTTVELILVVGGHARFADYAAAVSARPPTDPGTVGAPDDVAFQLYSSGTTGRPKGVMLTNDNFFGLLPVATDMWGLRADSVNLVAMPLFHIGGGGWAAAGMYMGAISVLVRDLDPAALVRLIGERRVTHGFVVPAVLQFMLMVPGVGEADFSSLEMVLYGASPISEDVLVKSVEIFGCEFWQAYGLTETTGAVVHLAPADHVGARLRSCGLPGPGVELRIVDTDGRDVPVGDVGEILIRSPQVMKGYWKMPEATAAAIDADGWFRSGDAGFFDTDGFLYIHDRVKDMIVSGAENVYPAEVENVLMAHPAIADVAVIGVPDDRWGETVKALVVRVPGAELDERAVIDFAREHLARFKCPTSVEWIDVLPRTPTGKILKKDLRAPYWVGRDRQVG